MGLRGEEEEEEVVDMAWRVGSLNWSTHTIGHTFALCKIAIIRQRAVNL